MRFSGKIEKNCESCLCKAFDKFHVGLDDLYCSQDQMVTISLCLLLSLLVTTTNYR